MSATLRLPGLGIPHLRVETRADVYRALGGVMASDRLWQTDLAVDSP